ncbi:FecR family protein [Parapedobacter sp. DT-150]|uniref:FecR family protein n=1 Tax=Parapedobacter sp. DT-150 TaxID=3396162 RepID=UPI003F1CC1E2
MSRENFHRLLQRYLDGKCTPEETQLVHHWYDMLDETHQGAFDAGDLDVMEDVIWNKIYSQINKEEDLPDMRKPLDLPKMPVRFWLVAAAVAALLITTGTLFYFRIVCYPVKPSFASSSAVLDNSIVRVTNGTKHHMKVILPDESLVELYPNAQLEYPKQFKAGSREVRLTGDAFFAVAANPENPFWVFHEGMITKVLGTKFKISAPKEGVQGEVIVYSGKVDVFYNVGNRNFVKRMLSAPEKASVTTNQKAVLLAQRIEETVVENPLPISEQVDAVGHETFRDISMTALAKTLSDLYALDVVADSSLAGITFTGDISGIGLFKQLDIISTVTSTHYEVSGTTIFLRHKD